MYSSTKLFCRCFQVISMLNMQLDTSRSTCRFLSLNPSTDQRMCTGPLHVSVETIHGKRSPASRKAQMSIPLQASQSQYCLARPERRPMRLFVLATSRTGLSGRTPARNLADRRSSNAKRTKRLAGFADRLTDFHYLRDSLLLGVRRYLR